jgi:hypothetical protein
MDAQVAAPPRLASGQRVRVTLSPDSVVTGVFSSLGQDQVWLRSSSIPVERVQLIELSQGRKPAWIKGLAYGALGGAVVGGLLYATITDEYMKDDSNIWIPVFIGAGIAGGALIGGGLSLILARERWSVVPREEWATVGSRWRIGFSGLVY